MKLTGKAKEDFQLWFLKSVIGFVKPTVKPEYYDELDSFYRSPEPMQWGVYVDFFDSVGIYLEDAVNNDTIAEKVVYDFYISLKNEHLEFRNDFFKTRAEARIAAITKANEIYNS